jgi:hypothetical protein
MGEAVRATLRGSFRVVRRVDLLGRPLDGASSASGLPDVILGPWEIGTFCLE